MSPLFCWVANSPSSEPVRRVKAAISGVCCNTRFDRFQQGVAFLERASRGRQVIDHEPAFVCFRQKSRTEPDKERNARGGEDHGRDDAGGRAPHHRGQRDVIHTLRPTDGRPRLCLTLAARAVLPRPQPAAESASRPEPEK